MGIEKPALDLQTFSYPADRIQQRPGGNRKENELENLGVRFLTVDVTPSNLRENPIFKENPLNISITEILPNLEDGVRASKRAFINAETHHEEGTSVAIANDLRNFVARMKKRSGLLVIATGLSEAVERLRVFLNTSPIDINRYFIGPFEQPKDDFEELAQNYLRFILSHYDHDFDLFDIHTDPLETDVEPYAILGRHEDPKRQKALLEWAQAALPEISVVFDLAPEEYFEKKLNRSLPDAVFNHSQCNRTLTVECTGGKSAKQKSVTIGLMHLVWALTRDGILDKKEGLELYGLKARELLNKGYYITDMPPSANELLNPDGDDRAIRREILRFPIGQRGVFRFSEDNRHKVLSAGSELGFIDNSRGAGSQTILVPPGIGDCVILGIPEVGIAGKHMPVDAIEISVAVIDN